MYLQVLSDVHVDSNHKKFPKISKKADVIVYAGDVGENFSRVRDYFNSVRVCTKVPIVYILGNMEYYGKVFHGCSAQYADWLSQIPDLHILDKTSVDINGVAFLGCTLWTDFDDYRYLGKRSDASNDFARMRKLDRFCRITSMEMSDIILEHSASKESLIREFKRHSGKDSVVLTHHCPSNLCVHEDNKDDPYLCLYCIEMSDIMIHYRPKVWVYGHTHKSCRKMVGSTYTVSNPYGYPSEGYSSYEEEFLIEV
ncbi:metallophosphoesterase family protein [bacterium]|nr:metallophosphoesterase family protein [bacterium]